MAGKTKDPRCMTASEINRALDRVDKQGTKLNDQFIAAGRGHERPSDIREMTDPLAKKFLRNMDEHGSLRLEISRRYGPNAPSRLPRGFGPIDKDYCRRKKEGLEGRRRRR